MSRARKRSTSQAQGRCSGLADQERWHARTATEVFAILEADPEGLDSNTAQERLQAYGPNQLLEKRRVSAITVFFDQFRNFMVIVLLIATLISGLLGEFTDAITIIIIIVANAVLGFFQQLRAEKSLASLRELTAPLARAVRAGQRVELRARDLVPGDIVLLEAGDRVPADIRLLRAQSLETEESSLTGESLPVEKSADPVSNEEALLGDRRSMAYLGTMVSRGTARGIVVATGMHTEMGKIADLIMTSEETATPLERRLDQLGQVLVYVSVAITVVVSIAGILHGHDVYEMFLAGVSLAVAAIPEGLPAIVTIALALGVQRMIRRKAIVRRLPSVETLGCATVICSDKTGTLTQNQMTVKEIYLDGRILLVEGDGYEATGRVQEGERTVSAEDSGLRRLVEIGLACNNASLVHDNGRLVSLGDPTEAALLTLAQKLGVKSRCTRIAEAPFDAERKRMSVLVECAGRYELLVKGAPDLLLAQCTHVMQGGREVPLTQALKKVIQERLDEMAGRALRTLGLAVRGADRTARDPQAMERGLTFVGIVGITDPPRKEVAQAIATCKQAGIRTVMITGDHRLTAEAIARELGILPKHGQVATGTELDRWSDRDLADRVDDIYVFARVSPLHKLRIVRALQASGHVVAMTGDGVNDAPAIKASDIGIAMGRTGTDVAKDASSLILADDNFATIVAAIEEGRSIYDNIRKFIRYLLTSNVGEIITMFAAMVMGLPLPLIPIQILWVNLVTDGLPAIALGVDSAEEDTMDRPPRSVREGIFARGLGRRIIVRGMLIGGMTLSVFAGALMVAHVELATAQTMAFATLVMAQLIHVFDCRSVQYGVLQRGVLGNLWLIGAVLSSLVLLLIVIYIPSLQPAFHTRPLGLLAWLVILPAAAVPTFIVQARRPRRGTWRKALAR